MLVSKQTPDEKVRDIEEKIWRKVLQPDYNHILEIMDVPVGDDRYIHTIKYGSPAGKPPMVLLHGYGGSSITFVRMVTTLAEKYFVFALDLPGLGLSSRNNCPKDTTSVQDTISYFVDAVEEWRKQMELTTFVLVGHSFGGYISMNYTLRYRHIVESLLLVSPVGIGKVSPTEYAAWKDNLGWIKRTLFSVWEAGFAKRMSPMELVGKFGFLKNYVIEKAVNKRFKGYEEELHVLIQDYFKTILEFPEGSEKAFYNLFKFRLIPEFPMEDHFDTVLAEVPTIIYYGDRDWMKQVDQQYAFRVHSKGIVKKLLIKEIKEATHQIVLDQPVALAQEMLYFLDCLQESPSPQPFEGPEMLAELKTSQVQYTKLISAQQH